VAGRRLLVAVTGTPGTGKSRFAAELAKLVPGASLIEINDIVAQHHLYSRIDSHGSKIVRMAQLEKRLKDELKHRRGTTIVVGHLIPEMGIRYDVCVVTRARLSRLMKVFAIRKYDMEKTIENLLAEALDYCGIRARNKANEVYEVMDDKDRRAVMLYIRRISLGMRATRPKPRPISLMHELLLGIKSGRIRL
jgi:broad-specificity NMP kinase